ncbi:MAG: helix-turn-helix domain-containing protein [Clostridiales bacterium]|nr:helix-turn-helix domain-containing protein [Clostridiales bacterium]
MPKTDINRALGDAVKTERGKMGFTQSEVAEKANIDVRALLNIENYRGNPTLQVIFSIIRVLNIDPKEIFYPESGDTNPALCQMRLLLSDCSENEIDIMVSICEPLITALRRNNNSSKNNIHT